MGNRSRKTGTPKKKKRDAPKHKARHAPTGSQANERKGFFRTTSFLRTLLFVILPLLAVAATLYALSPSLSVSSLAALNRSDPLSTPFTILNNGRLTAHHVQAKCSVIQAVDPNGKEISGLPAADAKTENLGDLHSKETATLPCSLASASGARPIISASGTIEVSYRPDFYPWRVEKRLGFITARGPDGELHW